MISDCWYEIWDCTYTSLLILIHCHQSCQVREEWLSFWQVRLKSSLSNEAPDGQWPDQGGFCLKFLVAAVAGIFFIPLNLILGNDLFLRDMLRFLFFQAVSTNDFSLIWINKPKNVVQVYICHASPPADQVDSPVCKWRLVTSISARPSAECFSSRIWTFAAYPSTIARSSLGCQTPCGSRMGRHLNKVSLAFFRCFREYDRLKGK